MSEVKILKINDYELYKVPLLLMHIIKFVIYISFNTLTKAQKPQTQNGYRRVQSKFHIHISAHNLRIMQFPERNKVPVTLKCYEHVLVNF
jgi:hypothetical protein